ncbi:hypothetical protein D4S03_09245 [bacterium]|nr:MAG: hypothetical protein D4S03_09245 [bacterium]
MRIKKEQINENEARAGMKSQLDQFKDCNFEELREGFIDFSKQMIDCQFRLLEEFGKLHAKTEKNLLATLKAMNKGIDRDFRIIEKNFKAVDSDLEKFKDKLSRIGAAAFVALARSIGTTEHLYKTGVLKKQITEAEAMMMVPQKVRTFIASTLDTRVKDMEKMIETYKTATKTAA